MHMADSFKLAIIGAGASGLMAAITARKHGIDDVTVFEKGADVGGTWFYNRYPGLACDVPSYAYSFSFALNPEWTTTFATGPEIHAYLKRLVTDAGLDERIRCSTEITEATLVDGKWHLHSPSGDEGIFDAVVSAVGILHKPIRPDIAGLDSFAGAMTHTAEWDESIVLDGKRVGIIGTGSTSTQLTIAIVDRVAKLSVFQRTPQWIFPQGNEEVLEEQKQAYRDNPESLKAEYDRLNYQGNYKFASAIVGQNKYAYAKLARLCEEHLEREVHDPELRAKLTPDYPVGCKRLVMSDKFYGAIQRPNAELVSEGIERIEPQGIRTKDGRLHELDVLVLATGFDPFYFLGGTEVTGRNGIKLSEAWAKASEGYLGVSVPDFPNWFMIGGPNSPLGNFSWLLTAEMQFAYILQLIDVLRSGKAKTVAPAPEHTAAFNAEIREAMQGTVWTAGCRSWYIDKNGNVASWPWTYDKFVELMKAPDLDKFEIA
jgi:cation diffusion facilitator CzcD-associated flavoprotein CzcO